MSSARTYGVVTTLLAEGLVVLEVLFLKLNWALALIGKALIAIKKRVNTNRWSRLLNMVAVSEAGGGVWFRRWDGAFGGALAGQGVQRVQWPGCQGR